MKTTNLFKSVSVLAIALMFGLTANAQVGNGPTDPKVKTNKLAVEVGEFYSLNLSSDNATIKLDTEEKFASGSQSDQVTMTIFSSRKYAVSAQVSSATFTGTNVNTNNIDLIVERISGNDEATATTRGNNSLKSTEAEQIASSTKATKADKFSLVYSIPSTNTAAFLDQFGKTINTEITYTLLPL